MLLKGIEEPGLYETGMGNRKQRISRESGRVAGDGDTASWLTFVTEGLLSTSPSDYGRPYS